MTTRGPQDTLCQYWWPENHTLSSSTSPSPSIWKCPPPPPPPPGLELELNNIIIVILYLFFFCCRGQNKMTAAPPPSPVKHFPRSKFLQVPHKIGKIPWIGKHWVYKASYVPLLRTYTYVSVRDCGSKEQARDAKQTRGLKKAISREITCFGYNSHLQSVTTRANSRVTIANLPISLLRKHSRWIRMQNFILVRLFYVFMNTYLQNASQNSSEIYNYVRFQRSQRCNSN